MLESALLRKHSKLIGLCSPNDGSRHKLWKLKSVKGHPNQTCSARTMIHFVPFFCSSATLVLYIILDHICDTSDGAGECWSIVSKLDFRTVTRGCLALSLSAGEVHLYQERCQ